MVTGHGPKCWPPGRSGVFFYWIFPENVPKDSNVFSGFFVPFYQFLQKRILLCFLLDCISICRFSNGFVSLWQTQEDLGHFGIAETLMFKLQLRNTPAPYGT